MFQTNLLQTVTLCIKSLTILIRVDLGLLNIKFWKLTILSNSFCECGPHMRGYKFYIDSQKISIISLPENNIRFLYWLVYLKDREKVCKLCFTAQVLATPGTRQGNHQERGDQFRFPTSVAKIQPPQPLLVTSQIEY